MCGIALTDLANYTATNAGTELAASIGKPQYISKNIVGVIVDMVKEHGADFSKPELETMILNFVPESCEKIFGYLDALFKTNTLAGQKMSDVTRMKIQNANIKPFKIVINTP